MPNVPVQLYQRPLAILRESPDRDSSGRAKRCAVDEIASWVPGCSAATLRRIEAGGISTVKTLPLLLEQYYESCVPFEVHDIARARDCAFAALSTGDIALAFQTVGLMKFLADGMLKSDTGDLNQGFLHLAYGEALIIELQYYEAEGIEDEVDDPNEEKKERLANLKKLSKTAYRHLSKAKALFLKIPPGKASMTLFQDAHLFLSMERLFYTANELRKRKIKEEEKYKDIVANLVKEGVVQNFERLLKAKAVDWESAFNITDILATLGHDLEAYKMLKNTLILFPPLSDFDYEIPRAPAGENTISKMPHVLRIAEILRQREPAFLQKLKAACDSAKGSEDVRTLNARELSKARNEAIKRAS